MAVTWQASWPPTRSRHEDRHPPDGNSSGVLGPARRGRGTVGDDLCVRPNHAALDPHKRPVHWPSPRAQSWCSDGSPAKAASRSPARSSRSATATPAGPSPCSSLAQSDQRIDRPPLPERASSGQLVSGKCGKAGVKGHAAVCGHLRPGRVSGAPMHAGYQRGHGYSFPQPRTQQLMKRIVEPVQDRCYRRPQAISVSMVGVRAGTVTGGSCANISGSAADCRTLALRLSGMPSRFRTPRTDGRVRCPSGGRWLGEPVVGLAAAGGM
jgi:hypothetical protein